MKLISQNTNIYALVDPRNNEIRYIGVTKNALASRLADHIRISKNNVNSENKHKNYWIKQLLDLNLSPKIIAVEESLSKKDAYKGEIWWIDLLLKLDFNLVNISKGGSKPPSWKGKKLSEKHKQKQSESIREYYKNNIHPSKGTSQTQEHIDKIQESRKRNGTKSDATIMLKKRADNPNWALNLSKAQKKRFSDPTKNVMYGKHHTELSNKKNSLGQGMRYAYLKHDYFLVCELQEDWKQLTGEYKPDYIEFAYTV